MSYLLDHHFRIRLGTDADAPACQQIARQHRKELPFVSLPQLKQSAAKGGLFVAECDGAVTGFVRWNATTRGANKGYSVVYDLAVDTRYQRLGIGRALLYAVPAPIRLLCKADNVCANAFYARMGMLDKGQTQLKALMQRWQLNVLTLFVMGGNKVIPPIAYASGMGYGVRNDYAPADWSFMIDIQWKHYDWQAYLALVQKHMPVQAMVADYEHPDQCDLMLSQVADLKALGLLRVLVCPKFDGAVRDIPPDCIVAISVPSRYAGFIASDLKEYAGRKVHLLGGKPRQWLDLIPKLTGIGAQVISVDGSSHEVAAKVGTHFESGKWRNYGKKADYEATMIYSGRRIVREVQAASEYIQRSF